MPGTAPRGLTSPDGLHPEQGLGVQLPQAQVLGGAGLCTHVSEERGESPFGREENKGLRGTCGLWLLRLSFLLRNSGSLAPGFWELTRLLEIPPPLFPDNKDRKPQEFLPSPGGGPHASTTRARQKRGSRQPQRGGLEGTRAAHRPTYTHQHPRCCSVLFSKYSSQKQTKNKNLLQREEHQPGTKANSNRPDTHIQSVKGPRV